MSGNAGADYVERQYEKQVDIPESNEDEGMFSRRRIYE